MRQNTELARIQTLRAMVFRKSSSEKAVSEKQKAGGNRPLSM
jgi:hypothetical protein